MQARSPRNNRIQRHHVQQFNDNATLSKYPNPVFSPIKFKHLNRSLKGATDIDDNPQETSPESETSEPVNPLPPVLCPKRDSKVRLSSPSSSYDRLQQLHWKSNNYQSKIEEDDQLVKEFLESYENSDEDPFGLLNEMNETISGLQSWRNKRKVSVDVDANKGVIWTADDVIDEFEQEDYSENEALVYSHILESNLQNLQNKSELLNKSRIMKPFISCKELSKNEKLLIDQAVQETDKNNTDSKEVITQLENDILSMKIKEYSDQILAKASIDTEDNQDLEACQNGLQSYTDELDSVLQKLEQLNK